MLVLGYGCIVAGGLVAAVTGPLELARGSWVAAYLVLVGGVAQLALGWVPGTLGRPLGPRSDWTCLLAWNLGNVLVVLATLTRQPLGVDLGSVLLALTLVLALVRAVSRRHGPGPDPEGRGRRLLAGAYVALLLVLVFSIGVGITLAHLR